MKWFGKYYVKEEDLKNPYVAPLLAKDVSNVPPAFVITAENDVLRDEGLAYAKRLQEAGVRVESVCEEGLVHGYFSNVLHFSERIDAILVRIARFLYQTTEPGRLK